MSLRIAKVENGVTFTAEFRTQRPMKYYKGIGKSFPLVTQCILSKNGLVISFASVTKHQYDEHNAEFAERKAVAKAITVVTHKGWRQKIWAEFFNNETI